MRLARNTSYSTAMSTHRNRPSSSLMATPRLVVQLLLLLVVVAPSSSAFVVPQKAVSTPMLKLPASSRHRRYSWSSHASSSEENGNNNVRGVIDLTDDDDEDIIGTDTQRAASVLSTAPFLSQGELSSDPNLLNPDFSDDKQNRVILYIILTLVPILFLVPLMIGSRDLIPLDILPPVELT